MAASQDTGPSLGLPAGIQAGFSATQVAYVNGDVGPWLPGPDQSARERYELALKYLDAGAAHRAARLITAVAVELTGDSVFSVNHVVFHQILAILSGRFYDELLPGEIRVIGEARARTDPQVSDQVQWYPAVELIGELLDTLGRRAGITDPDPALDAILRKIEALPGDCGEEVRRHLDPLLASAGEDPQRAVPQAHEQWQRSRRDRKARARKFFQPDPEEPTARKLHGPQFAVPARIAAAIGGFLALASVIAAIAVLQTGGAARAALLALILVLSSSLTVFAGVSYLAARERLTEKEREHGLQQHFGRYSSAVPELGELDILEELHFDENDPAEARMWRKRRRQFIDAATRYLDAEFARRAPQPQVGRRRWQAETAGLRRTLREEIVREYGDADLRPGALNWLITWRVKEIARAWNAGRLHEYRQTMQPHPAAVLGRGVGLAIFAVGCVYSLIVMLRMRPEDAVIAAALGVMSVILVAASQLDVYVVQTYKLRADQRDAKRKYAAERAEFDRWRDVLSDSPSDHEVARWLDYDKIYLKKLAMEQLALTHRDAVRYLVLAEPTAGSVRMRSPLISRYSAYKLTAVLLAEDGVRMLTATLDFCTGDIFDQERRSFRHDMIASATMVERGIPFDSGRQHPMRRGGNRAHGQPPPSAASSGRADVPPILRQDFLLRLTNGEDIQFLTESSDADVAVLGIDDPGMLLDLALDTSGITDALELLEMISGHGAGWVNRRRRK